MWTGDSGAAERLAAQVLLASGFQDPDPSHPYGGPDGGRDAIFTRDHERWAMAVYFPHGEKPLSEVKAKFTSDIDAAKKHEPKGVAFVTNQEITLGERRELIGLVGDVDVVIFHVEKVAALLDQPSMVGVRQQFLGIDPGSVPLNLQLKIDGAGYLAVDGNELREGLLEVEDESDRETAESRCAAPPSERHRFGALAGILNQEPPPPPTSEEVETAITQRRDRVEKVWGRIEDYIIGLTCPALHFTITNMAESFLHDLRVVINFAGAHCAEKLQADDCEHEKLLDPDYERPLSIYESTVYTDFKPKDYPVEWENKESRLEVRITLPELPPGEALEWSSDDYEDVVLVATSDEPIHVTWQAVARTYGTPFIGPTIEVPAEKFSVIALLTQRGAVYRCWCRLEFRLLRAVYRDRRVRVELLLRHCDDGLRIGRAPYRRSCFTMLRVSKRLTAYAFRESEVEAATSAADAHLGPEELLAAATRRSGLLRL